MDVLCVGHASCDVTMSVAHHPAADEKMQADAMDLCGGGPAANAAVQVARLGGTVAFVGTLGTDMFGDMHCRELQQAGVDAQWLVRRGKTPVSQILAKPDGCRSVINFKGDMPWLAADVLPTARMSAAVMLFDGHEPLLSVRLQEQAEQQGVMTVLDAGSVHQGTEALVWRVGHLVASQRFACTFCDTDDAGQALRMLAARRNRVVITLGAEGLLWFCDGEFGQLPAFPVDVVDSTGAGDAFHGAYALGLARGMDWQSLLRFASAAGALACTRLGARTALPDRQTVACLLASSLADVPSLI